MKGSYIGSLLKNFGKKVKEIISLTTTDENDEPPKDFYYQEYDCPSLCLEENEQKPIQQESNIESESAKMTLTDIQNERTGSKNKSENTSRRSRLNQSFVSQKRQRENELNNSTITMKSLSEIKSELDTRRKEAVRKINKVKEDKLISIDSFDPYRDYEERKKLLKEYYKKKAEKIKEVTLMMEKEKLKHENNFSNLSREGSSFLIKGKEKKMNLSVGKSTDFSINQEKKSNTFQTNTIQSNTFQSASNSGSLNLTKPLFGSQNESFKPPTNPKPKEQKETTGLFGGFQKQGTEKLFTSDNVKKEDEKSKTEIFSSNINKDAEEKKKTSLFDADSNSLFSAVKSGGEKVNTLPISSSANSGGIFGPNNENKNGNSAIGLGENKKNDIPSSSLFGNTSSSKGIFSAINEKEPSPLFGEKKDTVTKNFFANEEKKSSLFNAPNSKPEPQPSGNVSIFGFSGSNENKNENSNSATQKSSSEIASQLHSNNIQYNSPASSNGSLVNKNNPFLMKGNTTQNQVEIFKSPEKPSNTPEIKKTEGIFSSNQPKAQFGQPSTSGLFGFQNNNSSSGGLFGNFNSGSGNGGSLFGAPGNANNTSNKSILFGNNTSSLFSNNKGFSS